MSGGPSSWVLITPGQHGQGQPWRPCLKHVMSPTLVIVTEQGYKSIQHISWHVGCVCIIGCMFICICVCVHVHMCVHVWRHVCVYMCVCWAPLNMCFLSPNPTLAPGSSEQCGGEAGTGLVCPALTLALDRQQGDQS